MILGKRYIVYAIIYKWNFLHVDNNYYQRSICKRRKARRLNFAPQCFFVSQKTGARACAKITHLLALEITTVVNIYQSVVNGKWSTTMSASTAYEYTCRFCNAVHEVLASLQVANIAASAASRGDYEKAKSVILENCN